MESKIILIDTDFFWEYITGNPNAIQTLTTDNYDILSISAITVAELIKGCGNKIKLAKLIKLINDFFPIQVNEAISSNAIELVKIYHLSHNIGINNSYIAATCLFYNIELATCNIADYQYIPNLRLLKHSVQPKRKGWNFFL